MTPVKALVNAALSLAHRGWPVFPLHTIRSGHCSCGNSACGNVAKHPRTPHGLKNASCDEALIARWWAAGDSNIGIVTGPRSGILVLDVDVRHGGADTLADLERQHGPLPETVEVLTGGGGRHLYFRYPSRRAVSNSTGRLGLGLDVRGEGGYVVGPPSLHVSGRCYEWEAAHHPDDMAVADLPAWLVEQLTAPSRTDQDDGGSPAWRHLVDPIPGGERNTTLTSVAGWLRLYHPQHVVVALLQAINLARCQPPLNEEEVSSIVQSMFRYPQPGVNGHPKAALPRYVREDRYDG